MTIPTNPKIDSKGRGESPSHRIPSRRRLPATKALSMLGSLTLATGGLMTASSLVLSPANADPVLCGVPTGTGLQQNLNTTLGCDVVEGTSLMSGYISDNGLQPGQVVTLEDAYEGLSSHLFYYGTYILTLNCQSGTPSAASTTYSIVQGTGNYPGTPPTVIGTLPSVTADSSGNIVCAYTLAVESAPSGQLNSSKSDLWIVAGGSGNTATASVKPPVLSPSDPGDTTTTTSTTDPGSTTTTSTTDPGSTTTTSTTDPGSTTTTSTTDPGSTTTTSTTDPGSTTTTSTTDPGSTTTTPTSDPGSTTTTPTTAPPLQTQTVSDPTNGPTHVYDPVVSDPGAAAPSTPGASTAGDPANPTVFNPRGLTALAFTGSNTSELAAIGLMLILFGGLVLGLSRRWVKSRAR
jgi:hypothetical protein